MARWNPFPADLYALVERTPATILLESAPPSADSQSPLELSSPVSRLFTDPVRVCVANHPADLPGLFAEIEQSVATGHYAAGYFAYECASFFEPTAPGVIRESEASAEDVGGPLAWFGIYRQPRIFDHESGRFLDEGAPAEGASAPSSNPSWSPSSSPDSNACDAEPDASLDTAFSLTEPEYARRIEQIHAFIRAGDVYQLNFTLPIAVRAGGSAAALYRRLRAAQPVPYSAFLHTRPGHRILSLSPELFFRIDPDSSNRQITTRPMKGTASRGRTTAEDIFQARWLAADAKNRAENVMIVDLLRNDLGRICTFGSVRATDLFAVERHPTLWQMTSTVTGSLRSGVGFQDIFRALFPSGSVTGAPKIRAMQLIGRLEGRPRGIYTGAIGFFSRQQSVFNVAIRTLAHHGGQGTMGVGSGIVIDSNPADEWRECRLKARFLTGASDNAALPPPESFSLVETLLWNGDLPLLEPHSYPLLELHLDRLEDSAQYFGLPFDQAEARAALIRIQTPGAPSFHSSIVEGWEAATPNRPLSESPKPPGAPGPSHLGTWETANPNPPLSESPRTPGAPSFHSSIVEGWEAATPNQPLSESPKPPGAPGPSHLGTWETTNPNRPLSESPHTPGAPSFHSPIVEGWEAAAPRKVRLLLHPDGSIQITSDPIPVSASHPLRIAISPHRTDPADPMYFHKTTHRPLYAQALQAALAAGYDDVLFVNVRGEVTETAIHNVFIETGGRLLTPPLDCGLLPGVHRRHILATHPTASEQVLTLQDLRSADAIYLCNAVRGLRPAIIDWE